MYGVSPLMSTPAASSSGSESKREYSGKLSPTCTFPSFDCDFLNSDNSFECCSIDPLTGSLSTCRRSPRLLSNGYYVWTENSFFCDKDGTVTLSPSQTRVLYKENLVRIFRKKKRSRHSFSSVFNLTSPKSWLNGSIFDEADSSPGGDIWLEQVRRLETHHLSESGGDADCSLIGDWESEVLNAEFVKASTSSYPSSQTSRESPQDSSLQSHLGLSEHFQGNLSDHSKTTLLQEALLQVIFLVACLIMSACARWFLEGVSASVCTCSVVITIGYVGKSLFLSLARYFKATSCAWFAKIQQPFRKVSD